MPDITMCVNNSCPIRTTCYRFMAEPSRNGQSWADFKYEESMFEGLKGSCEDFWDIEGDIE